MAIDCAANCQAEEIGVLSARTDSCGWTCRTQIETHDGAQIYVQYLGLLEVNEKVQSALANGTGTEFEDQYFYTNPRMETGDERYAWVNTTFFVGEGRIMPDLSVGYRIWRPA